MNELIRRRNYFLRSLLVPLDACLMFAQFEDWPASPTRAALPSPAHTQLLQTNTQVCGFARIGPNGRAKFSLSKELSSRDGCVFELERIFSCRFIARSLWLFTWRGYLEMARRAARILRELLIQPPRDIGYNNISNKFTSQAIFNFVINPTLLNCQCNFRHAPLFALTYSQARVCS